MAIDKREALRILFQCCESYEKNLRDQVFLIISADRGIKKTSAVEILFERTNFLHLTGVKFPDGRSIAPDSFYKLCQTQRLSINDFALASDGTTELKLLVLPKIARLSNLGANMIGDYYDRRPVLVTDKLVGGIRGCIGIKYDAARKNYAPNTVLCTDMRLSIRNPQRIIAMYKKNKSEKEYCQLVYKAKKVKWEDVRYPDTYNYIPIPLD